MTGNPHSLGLLRAERLTLAVLMCGVASLALSDFVSPFYWSLSIIAALLRLWRGPSFHLSEMQASFIGWAGFVWVGVELLAGRELVVAFTDFLLILALAVVVETATPRNHLHRMLVGIFLLLGAAVLTDSVLFVLPLAAMMWFLWRAAACLYGLNWPGGNLSVPAVGKDIRCMGGMALLIAAMFVLLPRFEFHSLLKATQPKMQTSGFSDRVNLGDFARELDETIVMRVESTDEQMTGSKFRQVIEARYWRGAALSHFTGKGWQRQPARSRSLAGGESLVLSQQSGFGIAVYREASDHAYVHLPNGLQRILRLPEPARIDALAALKFRKAPSRRLRLNMQLGNMEIPLDLRSPLRWEWDVSRIPSGLTDWVESVTANAQSERQALAAVTAELKGWRYDLDVPVNEATPVISFLENKRGHCELFATTLALAARSIGYASRVVNGYRAGEWNDVGGFLVIRQKHAHSWTEIWLDGQWRPMDVTPASRWQMFDSGSQWLEAAWESVRLSWYRYVLDFQDSDRGTLFNTLLQLVRAYLPWLAGAVLLLFGLLKLWRYRAVLVLFSPLRKQGDLWPLMDRWLKKHGVARQPFQPLRDVTVPEGVSTDAWQLFQDKWEKQAYRLGEIWQRRDLKRHLRALLKAC